MRRPDLEFNEEGNCGVTAAIILSAMVALASPSTTPLVDTENGGRLSDISNATADQVRAVGCEPSERGLKPKDYVHPEAPVYTGTVFSWLLTGDGPPRCHVPWTAVWVEAPNRQ